MRSLPLAPALTQQLSPFLVVVNLRGHTQETTAALPRASSPNRDNGLGPGDEGYVEGGGSFRALCHPFLCSPLKGRREPVICGDGEAGSLGG